MTSKPSVHTIIRCLLCLWGAHLSVLAEGKTTNAPEAAVKQEETAPDAKPESGEIDSGEPKAAEEVEKDPRTAEVEEAAVARPVSADPVQVYGWREWIFITDGREEMKLQAKLDSGALTSSIHAEDIELFERDGKKWVRFVVTDPGEEDFSRMRIEAPLVRIARIKEPAGESQTREVVRLSFKIGDRNLKAEFTLNNRVNMLSPVLIGRTALKELGWVDSSRAYLADKKLIR